MSLNGHYLKNYLSSYQCNFFVYLCNINNTFNCFHENYLAEIVGMMDHSLDSFSHKSNILINKCKEKQIL